MLGGELLAEAAEVLTGIARHPGQATRGPFPCLAQNVTILRGERSGADEAHHPSSAR
jgi:hypothetical protein